MAEYRKDVSFAGEHERAIRNAAQALGRLGYRITELTPTRLKAEHPGILQRSSAQALLVASPLSISLSLGRLKLEAEFEGIAKLRRFLVRLLVGLAAFLGFALGITFSIVFDETWPVLLGVGLGVGIPILQLPIHVFLTLRLIKRRAISDLDIFLENLVVLSQA